jgi:hypothetical protein
LKLKGCWIVACERIGYNSSSSGRATVMKRTPVRTSTMSKHQTSSLNSTVSIQVPLVAFAPLRWPPFATSSQFPQWDSMHQVTTFYMGGDVRATPSALPPFGTFPLFFTLFGFGFAPEWLWSKPSLAPSPLFMFGGPSVPSPRLIPVFAPCGSHLCTPRRWVGLVPWMPVYFWFCYISCLGDSGFVHAGPSRPNYISS